jgi:ribosomal protein L22
MSPEEPEDRPEDTEAEAPAEPEAAADAEEAPAPKRRRRRRGPAAASEAEAKESEAPETEAVTEEPVAEADEEPEAEADEEPEAEADEEPEAEAEEEPEAEAEEEPEAEAEEEPEAGAEEEPEAAAEEEPAAAAPPARSAPSRRRSRERDPDLPPPVVRAQAKYVRSSARKARLVCDHIRGKSVDEARAILALTPRAIARDWSKLLESAIANAEHNHELVGEDLYVKAVHADEGPTIKRFRPRAMGRATRIRKRTSHLTILLEPKD